MTSTQGFQGTLEFRAALWALGNIGSTDIGISAILDIFDKFIDWLINQTISSQFLSIRGTCFFILGLISRTEKGSRRLREKEWFGADSKGVAVVVPNSPADLFKLDNNIFCSPRPDFVEIPLDHSLHSASVIPSSSLGQYFRIITLITSIEFNRILNYNFILV